MNVTPQSVDPFGSDHSKSRLKLRALILQKSTQITK